MNRTDAPSFRCYFDFHQMQRKPLRGELPFAFHMPARLFSGSRIRKSHSDPENGNRMHRRLDLQMSLPLPYDGWSENALREAHRAARIRLPFEEAMRDRALEICLRCFAEARLRRLGKIMLPSGDLPH